MNDMAVKIVRFKTEASFLQNKQIRNNEQCPCRFYSSLLRKQGSFKEYVLALLSSAVFSLLS